MFDLNEQTTVPRYELKLKNDETKSYDTLLLSYGLRDLDAEGDTTKIKEVVNKLFEIEVDAYDALLILFDFTKFAEKNLEGPLKKVCGRGSSLTITTASRPENTKT